jgi:hypothetical protein
MRLEHDLKWCASVSVSAAKGQQMLAKQALPQKFTMVPDLVFAME